jgi:hypothetical protein
LFGFKQGKLAFGVEGLDEVQIGIMEVILTADMPLPNGQRKGNKILVNVGGN